MTEAPEAPAASGADAPGVDAEAPASRSVQAPDPEKGRLAGLDVLRFVAIVLVIGRHFHDVPADWPAPLRILVGAWQRGGWVGVDLFFVLSGFLVSGLLFTEYRRFGAISPWRFYLRRGWKIYPAFYFLILVTLMVVWLGKIPVSAGRILAELFFLQSYRPGLWVHTWSLAVEEHFYLLLPPLLWLLFRATGPRPLSLRRLALAVTASGCAFLALRLLLFPEGARFVYYQHFLPTHLRMDELFFGVGLAYWFHFHPDHFARFLKPWRGPLLVAGLLCFLPPFVFELEETRMLATFGLTLLYLGAGMVLAATLSTELPRRWPILAMARLGSYSYSIYLWHLAVAQLLVPALERLAGFPFPYGWQIGLSFVLALAVGVAMAHLIELPFLRLRERFHPSRTRVGSR